MRGGMNLRAVRPLKQIQRNPLTDYSNPKEVKQELDCLT